MNYIKTILAIILALGIVVLFGLSLIVVVIVAAVVLPIWWFAYKKQLVKNGDFVRHEQHFRRHEKTDDDEKIIEVDYEVVEDRGEDDKKS